MSWRLAEGVTLCWRDFGDEAAVFNEASGRTHVCDAFSAWVLRAVEGGPTTLGELADRLVNEVELDEADALGQVDKALTLLCEKELVEPQRRHP
ncbi:MAG: HPr-rel-A system PqqD family peptide chaperone [Rhodospirillales bacterium]|nr:MAG: HPr-rel-A system PqqD family peptide chaperone [Rhodospirillales bacterium]